MTFFKLLRSTRNDGIFGNLIHKAQFCVSVCFNSSKTAIGTGIKLGVIDHHLVVNVVKVFMTS